MLTAQMRLRYDYATSCIIADPATARPIHLVARVMKQGGVCAAQ